MQCAVRTEADVGTLMNLLGGMMRHPDVRHPDVLSKYVRPQASSFQAERESEPEPDSGSRSATAVPVAAFPSQA